VVLWNEEEGLSFYPKKLFYQRDVSLSDLQREITCFVLHHSVTYTAHSTFRALLGRGLSVNFIIDDDVNTDGVATIFQCADIKEACWSQGQLNRKGAGVEISYHPEAWENTNLYSKENIEKYGVQPHEIIKDEVFGKTRNVYAPTEAQVKACIKLMYGYSKLFPYVRPEFPKDKDGKIERHVITDLKGFLLHANSNPEKTDPSGLPLDRIEKEIISLRAGDAQKKTTLKFPIKNLLNFAKHIIKK
jgi:hypothetical protein